MTRKAFLEKYFLRFAASLAMIGLIVYTVYHVFGSSSGSLMTTPVCRITDYQIVSGEAYLFRNEEVLSVSSAGVINTLVAGGEKIGKNVTLAEVWHGYSDAERADAQIELDHLNRMIAVVEGSLLSSDDTLSKASHYRSLAQKDYLEVRSAVAAGKLSAAQRLEDSLLTVLNRYDAIIGKTADLSVLLTDLKQERAALLHGTYTVLTNTKSSGYFYGSSYVDGYESAFSMEALENLTSESFDELKALQPRAESEGFAVGKMVYDNMWYLAVELSDEAGAFLQEAVRYSFTFPDNADKTLFMTCTRLLPKTDGGVIAVFSSNELPSDFTYLRTQTVEIVVESCEGYHVPESALHEVDGVLGVYVFEESTVYFRRVEVLYYGDGYVIVAEQSANGSGYLALNDLMVTSGDGLRDGRVYK